MTADLELVDIREKKEAPRSATIWPVVGLDWEANLHLILTIASLSLGGNKYESIPKFGIHCKMI